MMFSIRKRSVAIAALLVVAVAGCQSVEQHEAVAPLQRRQIIVDQAMQQRDWPVSVATFQSGGIVSDPTLLAFEPAQKLDPPLNGSMFEVPVFLLNVGLMPIVALSEGIWTPTAYHGVNLPASYTMYPAYPEDLPQAQPRPRAAGAEADAPMARRIRPATQP